MRSNAGGAGRGRLRRAELCIAVGRDFLGPGPAGPAGTRVEEAGALDGGWRCPDLLPLHVRSPQPTRAAGGQYSELVLVVEDDDRVRAISAETLRELGYSVIEANGAREAIRIIEGGAQPDLLFTDVVMPEMSGRELAKVLQQSRPKMKVLFTTGYTRNAIVHNGVLDPGMHLISKPFNIEDLAAKVRNLLDDL